MKITIDIEGKDYHFELNRTIYKKLLADKEYAAIQDAITKKDNADISALQGLIMQEQVFYYSLLMHQPNMSSQEASDLLDKAYDEYGMKEVNNLVSTLVGNFTPGENQPKKKMVMRMN